MKKIIFLIISLVSMMFATTASAIQGEGTEESPFLITTQAELETVSDFPTCHFKLENDIVLEGEWNALCKDGTLFTGVFDGNGYTISNLTMSEKGLFYRNNGTIKNLNVTTSDNGIKSTLYQKYVGGIACYNYSNGIIMKCSFTGNISLPTERYAYYVEGSYYPKYQYSYAGGISYSNDGVILECRTEGKLAAAQIAGIAYTGDGSITNCYSTASISGYSAYGIGSNATNCYYAGTSNLDGAISSSCENSFYDKTISGMTSTYYGAPKTTIAMKMKKTYTDAGWDFQNVWGIDADKNDGYPYLLWEYENENPANAEIIGATATDSTLKFISEVHTEGESEISAFGTTFIPLWLFESGSSDVAAVEYNNADYNIQNAQTYGATLTNIPESCKDMEIVGKSYIKIADGTYTWSKSKYASVNNTTLNELE